MEEIVVTEAVKLWFFRDLTDGQRRELIRLTLGEGCAKEATNHSRQRFCLNHILRLAAEQAQAAEIAELRAERDALLEKPLSLAKMDSIDGKKTDQMIAYYWHAQAVEARAERDALVEDAWSRLQQAYDGDPKFFRARINSLFVQFTEALANLKDREVQG